MREQILNILEETGALMEGHFLLSSGKHSKQYVQCAKVLRFPNQAEKILSYAVEKIKDLEIDLVVGPAMGGVVVAYEVGRQLGKEAIFTERENGEMAIRRGFEIKKGDKIIITEDVVTTGKSTLEVKKVIEEAGGIVQGVLCIIDRRPEGQDIGMPVYSSIEFEIETYDKENCPMCKANLAVVKPGSRNIKL